MTEKIEGHMVYTKYSQCGFLLTKEKYTHTVKDCEVRIGSGKNSDHYPIYTEVRTNIELEGKEKQAKE